MSSPTKTLDEEAFKAKHGKELEQIAIASRRNRVAWADLCGKIRQGEVGWQELAKGPVERLVPFYVLLSDKMADLITKDALGLVKKAAKPRGDRESVSADDWLNDFLTKDHGLTPDHIDAIKVKYLDPSVKDCVTLNLKQLEADLKALDKKLDSEDEDEDYEEDEFEDKVLLKEESTE